ncbi:DnaJ subfamily C member 25-like [Homarus americanus]|uniref:DnaJ subfamily C member 25-like n=1 Tax=Homarus americanus TaxID=6706 RepID=A0A8J5JXI1_HOMAM|nr:DnaJ subfamily C member 25-like [Homarus americanus]
MMWRFLLLYSLCIVFQPTNGYVEDYYCGENNCYDLKRAFRAVASKTHPDKFQDPEEKKIAEERFRILSTAYDILRDDEAREDYDYMLDHPEQFYQNVYRAWRRRMAPHVDVRIVLAATISLISLVQYYNGWMKYQEAIKYFAVVPKYRLQAVELAKQEGLLITDKKKDILWIQLVFLPYWIVKYISWYLRWVWKFWILKEEYGEEEKMYIIRKFMGLSHGQFENLEENIKADYLKRELWNKDKYNEWKADRDAEMKVKMAQSGRYKSYRRYMKANGPGRMYFDDS